MPCTVVMPVGAVASKVAACRGYGAEVVLHGAHVGESLAHLERLREERGLTLVHPYDDPEVLLGNGSCGLEILEDLPDVDVVVAGIGGGGLIGGVATAIKESRPSVRVYGVEPVGSEAMTRGLEAGEPVRVAPVSVADGLGAPFAGRYALRRRPAVRRGRGPDRRPDDPRRAAVRRRAAQAGPRAGRRGRARRGAHGRDPDPDRATGCA